MLKRFINIKFVVTSLFFIILIISSITLFYQRGYDELRQNQIELRVDRAAIAFKQSEHFFLEDMKEAINTNRLLANSTAVEDYVSDFSLKNENILKKEWLTLLKNQSLFTQIRFLNHLGQEKIRVHDTNIFSSEIYNHLQDKSERDYFKYAQTIKAGEIGSFGIDLEKELNEFYIPYTPAFRVIVPIDINQKRLGYIIANYDVIELLEVITYRREEHLRPQIVFQDGSYIIAHDENKQFGSQIPGREQYNLSIENPALWANIQKTDFGHYLDNDNLYIYHKIHMTLYNKSRYMLVFKTIPLTLIAKEIRTKADKLLGYVLVFSLTLVCFLLLLGFHFYRRLFHMESELALAALQGMSALVITDKKFTILKVNAQFSQWSQYNQCELIGQDFTHFNNQPVDKELYNTILQTIDNDGFWKGEITTTHKNGSPAVLLMRIQTVDSIRAHYIISFNDITQRVELEQKLREQSERDGLTGCWNRRIFDKQLIQQVSMTKRYGDNYSSCLAILDLDHFKLINDTYGHSKGDEVLIKVSTVMQQTLRETDFIARVGGEEFAIILPYIKVEDAFAVLERLRVIIQKAFDIDVTVSGGLIAFSSTLNETELYKKCDEALYQAKANGRNKIVIYKESEDNSL
jgi:diguanylate cyclase (GGDEF)-like protein/PAS domain S-box-containing protein